MLWEVADRDYYCSSSSLHTKKVLVNPNMTMSSTTMKALILEIQAITS